MKTQEALKIANIISKLPVKQQIKEVYALAMCISQNIGAEIIEDLKNN
mgnify:CR=1 FL=1|tara:strand:+ start:73 stop:216 length:144 start_codon:yes stop_codon:yes gene_type:complete